MADFHGITSELKTLPTLDRQISVLSSISAYDDSHSCNPVFKPSSDLLAFYAVLIDQILPSIEAELDNLKVLNQFIDVFTSLGGVSSLVSRIQSLVSELETTRNKPVTGESDFQQRSVRLAQVRLLCYFLGKVLMGEPWALNKVWNRVFKKNDDKFQMTHKEQLKEIISLFAGSRILSVLSAARQALNSSTESLSSVDEQRYDTWESLTIGQEYSIFLASEISNITMPDKLNEENLQYIAKILEVGLKVGYLEAYASELVSKDRINHTLNIFPKMGPSEQRKLIVDCLLPYYQRKYLDFEVTLDKASWNCKTVSAIAALLLRFIIKYNSQTTLRMLVALIRKCEESLTLNINARRVVALICVHFNELNERIFQELVASWGDEFGIKRHPMAIQQSQTELLLLLVTKLDRSFIDKFSSTSIYLTAISNRLAALSSQQRIMGTVVAEEVSSLCSNKNVKPLDFDLKGMHDEEQEFLKELVSKLNDKLELDDGDWVWSILRDTSSELPKAVNRNSAPPKKNKAKAPLIQKPSENKAIIIEVLDSDEDMKPYPLPEDDKEDSDDDPAIVDRNPIRSPVYIKELMEYLSSDDYKKHLSALTNAADLIRRKAAFGSELDFWAQQLAAEVIGLRDNFSIENFEELKLQALVALVASSPTTVPRYLASLLFNGDYSLQQRMVLLSAIALGARELGGLDEMQNSSPFPTKQLPPGLEKLFNDGGVGQEKLLSFIKADERSSLRHVNEVTLDLQRGMLKPTVAENEVVSGPKVLRISKKLEKERAGKDHLPRTSTHYNRYAKLAANKFVYPLTSQWYNGVGLRGMGTYSEILVGHFLKTLALLLHASYPSSTEIPDMTNELLNIALSLRTSTDSVVQDGLLTILLIVLEINDHEFLVSRWSRQLMELKTWLEDNMSEFADQQVGGLAAGVLYKLLEITEKYQQQLIGSLTGLQYEGPKLQVQKPASGDIIL